MTQNVQADQTITFSSVRENIALVEKFVDETCQKINVPEEHYGNILIALTEAVSNAIIHGNQSDESKQVSLGINNNADQGKVSFYVEDQGVGFDYNDLPDPTDPANIENPDGRGVFLMRNLADEVSFNESGNRVELSFSL